MNKKITCLEGLRGWAALVVFLHHFLLGFCPQWDGLISGAIPGRNIKETPLFFFVNGGAAVTIFFVLSGFVLSLYLWEKPSGILKSTLKRWPRLTLLPLISVLFVYLLKSTDLLYFKQAAKITHSAWMDEFGFSSNHGNFTERFIDVFLQGYLLTFFRGDQSLNSSLWTMNIEFIGSCIVFAFVSVCNNHKLKHSFILAILISAILFFKDSYYYVSFLAGALLSKAYLEGLLNTIKNSHILKLLFATSIIFLGYAEPGTGFYSFMSNYSDAYIRIYLHTTCAVIVICFCLTSDIVYNFFSNSISRYLGRISFSLYVIHVPILFSLSSFLFLTTFDYGYKFSIIITITVTLVISSIIAYGLSLIDDKWCQQINKKFSEFDNLTKT